MRVTKIVVGAGAVLVLDSLGHVWLRDRVCLRAVGLKTRLVEASMIVGAVRAVIHCILLSAHSIYPVVQQSGVNHRSCLRTRDYSGF